MTGRIRAADEDGIALVMAVLILSILTIVTITAISHTSASSRDASLKTAGQQAYALGEAGVNNALSQLASNYPSGAASGGAWTVSSPSPQSYPGGTVTWQSTYAPNPSPAGATLLPGTWTITATGAAANPTGGSSVHRTVRAYIDVLPTQDQTGAPPAWSYVYVKTSTPGCDLTLDNSVELGARLYMPGNLCIDNGATATGSPLKVGGQIWVEKSSSSVGKPAQGGNPQVNVAELWVGGGCKYMSNAATPVCLLGAAPVGQNIFASAAGFQNATAPPVLAPNIDFAAMYNAIQPSAGSPCRTGSLPTAGAFETDAVRNSSVTLFDLTPTTTSYSCKTPTGSIAWDLPNKQLTVSGALYIDGNAQIDGNGLPGTKTIGYTGQAAIYLTGTMLFANQINVCAVVTSGTCDNSGAWDPNTRFLIIAADGNYNTGTGTCAGSPPKVPAGDSLQLQNSTQFQGGLYGTCTVDLGQSATVAGPIIGTILATNNSAQMVAFPLLTDLPFGTYGQTITSYTLSEPYGFAETPNP